MQLRHYYWSESVLHGAATLRGGTGGSELLGMRAVDEIMREYAGMGSGNSGDNGFVQTP